MYMCCCPSARRPSGPLIVYFLVVYFSLFPYEVTSLAITHTLQNPSLLRHGPRRTRTLVGRIKPVAKSHRRTGLSQTIHQLASDVSAEILTLALLGRISFYFSARLFFLCLLRFTAILRHNCKPALRYLWLNCRYRFSRPPLGRIHPPHSPPPPSAFPRVSTLFITSSRPSSCLSLPLLVLCFSLPLRPSSPPQCLPPTPPTRFSRPSSITSRSSRSCPRRNPRRPRPPSLSRSAPSPLAASVAFAPSSSATPLISSRSASRLPSAVSTRPLSMLSARVLPAMVCDEASTPV